MGLTSLVLHLKEISEFFYIETKKFQIKELVIKDNVFMYFSTKPIVEKKVNSLVVRCLLNR